MSSSLPPAGAGEVNPYQTPASGPVAAPVIEESQIAQPEGPLRFWEGRKALLQSLFYMRCFAIVTALVSLRGAQALFAAYFEADPISGQALWRTLLTTPSLLINFVMLLATVVVALYFCFAVWRYARHLREVAGMHQRDPTALCQDHLWIWQLKLLMVGISVAREIVNFLVARWVVASIAP